MFDVEKDKVLDTWEHESGLEVSLRSYNNGEPKLQVGPRWYESKGGDRKAGKAGRLSMSEVEWLATIIVEKGIGSGTVKGSDSD